MIIGSEKDVTKAVLSELDRAKNPRLKEIMSALVRHLHDFAREVKLTEEEFQAAVGTELVERPLMDTLSVDLGFQNAKVIFARLFGNVDARRG
jgi:hypothetical protein